MNEALAALSAQVSSLAATVDSAIAAGIGTTPGTGGADNPVQVAAIVDATAALKVIADRLTAAIPVAG